MQASYSLSQAVLPTGGASTVDLLVRFRAPEAAAEALRRPLNLSLVIDRSGSMAGPSLGYAIRAAEDLVDRLGPEDTLSVVVYDDHVDTIVPPQSVTDKDAIKAELRRVRPGGTTNLSGGWLQGCEHVQAGLSGDKINRVLLLTDGQANVGVTSTDVLTNTAGQKGEQNIVTTTLGFGSHFNEDLLIGMARAGGGNFYYVQSPEDAADVFRIELDSLKSVAAQNFVATITPAAGVTLSKLLNGYKVDSSGGDGKLVVTLGDIYQGEDKLLALEIALPAYTTTGTPDIATLAYSFDDVSSGKTIERGTGTLTLAATIGSIEEASAAAPATDTVLAIARIRIATAKDAAVLLADQGKIAEAVDSLKAVIKDLQDKGLGEQFEIAEELDQLEYFARRIERRQLDSASRKEMRDQSFQAQQRSGRADLSLRGATNATDELRALPVVSDIGSGVEVECFRESGKLRIRVVSDGYAPSLNIQFPRAIRAEGVHYVVDSLELSADGSFYRAQGDIKRLVRPGETDPLASLSYSGGVRRSGPAKASTGPASAADLEATDTVGDGILVQCVKDGSKLRARVVSDGYDPDWNMRFPRSVREEGMLYVVDEVNTGPDGKSYIACGKIKRFVQNATPAAATP